MLPSPAAALAAAALALALGGCSGADCGQLPALTAERDAARSAQLDLTSTPGFDLEQATSAHDALHALEQRVYDLEQGCTD